MPCVCVTGVPCLVIGITIGSVCGYACCVACYQSLLGHDRRAIYPYFRQGILTRPPRMQEMPKVSRKCSYIVIIDPSADMQISIG